MLRHLATYADCHQFGFLPGCEPAEMWLLLQGMLELSHQQSLTKGRIRYRSDKGFRELATSTDQNIG